MADSAVPLSSLSDLLAGPDARAWEWLKSVRPDGGYDLNAGNDADAFGADRGYPAARAAPLRATPGTEEERRFFPALHDPWYRYDHPDYGNADQAANALVQSAVKHLAYEPVAAFREGINATGRGDLDAAREAAATAAGGAMTGSLPLASMLGAKASPTTMSALFAGPAAERAAAEDATSAAKPSITAYHGSPHDFDRFDLSKIGTGEGAQAFGNGLYFAENENTAKSYRPKTNVNYTGDPLNDDAVGSVTGYIEAGYEPEEAIRRAAAAWRNMADSARKAGRAGKADDYRKIYDQIDAFNPKDFVTKNPGKLYQVSINADPEHFLDWDKPLSEQSEQVRKVFAKFGHEEGATGEQAYRSFVDKSDESKKQRMAANMAEFQAGRLAQREVNQRNQKIWNEPEQLSIAEQLREAGIPGIKYLDQGSRASGEGSRNYVVFDDKLIDILKKYGLLGLAALPALQGATSGQPPLSSLQQQ